MHEQSVMKNMGGVSRIASLSGYWYSGAAIYQQTFISKMWQQKNLSKLHVCSVALRL
jgi:hypothetical protein